MAGPKSPYTAFYDVFDLECAKTSIKKTVIYSVLCSDSRQNTAIYNVFSLSEPQNRAQTMVFTMFLQQRKKRAIQKHRYNTFRTPHVRNRVFYSVFEPPLQKHWYLQCFEKVDA